MKNVFTEMYRQITEVYNIVMNDVSVLTDELRYFVFSSLQVIRDCFSTNVMLNFVVCVLLIFFRLLQIFIYL